MASNSAAAPALLVFAGALIITQTLFGQALERLGLKAALTGGSGGLSGTVVGPITGGKASTPSPAVPGSLAAQAQADGQQGLSHYLPGSTG